MSLKLINFGIASRQGDDIYINKQLLAYPELYYAILGHELAHTSHFSMKDIVLDIRNEHLKGKKIKFYKFILENPSSWSEFSPFWFYNGKFTVNPLILLVQGLVLCIIGGLLWKLI